MYLLRIRLYAQYDGENFGDFVNEDLLEKKKKMYFFFYSRVTSARSRPFVWKFLSGPSTLHINIFKIIIRYNCRW